MDVFTEGQRELNLLEWRGIPKAEIKKLRDLLESKLKDTDSNPAAARSALRALFEERNAWEEYSDDYEDTMGRWARKLFWWTVGLLPVATLCLCFAARFSPLLIFGMLCAGAAGSSVSVLARMPGMDVSLSNELDAYDRRVLSRIGIGIIASLIGLGLLAWLPVSVQNQPSLTQGLASQIHRALRGRHSEPRSLRSGKCDRIHLDRIRFRIQRS
jgi:hypothetical protein